MTFVWLGALFIGLTLGLLGSGGAILTVPILTYIVGQEPKIAIASSLLIVAIISLFTAIPYAKQKLIKWKIVLLFGIPGIFGATVGAWASIFISSTLQMIIFASLILVAAYLMLKPLKIKHHQQKANYKLAIDGLIIGAITGLTGVGGGFLIIPALVLMNYMPMRLAVGTSLIIITANSLAGFIKYLQVYPDLQFQIDWQLIIIFSFIGVIGGLVGSKIGKNINQYILKKAFGGFLLVIGVVMLFKNITYL